MTDSTLTPTDSLQNRSKTLRNQRRLKGWQGVWRFLFLCGVTGGLVWGVNLPHWLIQEKSQIKILGNEQLHEEQIHTMLGMSYPTLIWKLPIHRLRQKLESQPPIETVYLTRELLPPEVTIMVEEREPVAKATMGREVGFIDNQGVWIPERFYQGAKVQPSVKFKVLGLTRQSLSYWETIYPLVVNSTIEITALDWRDPSNLILHTALGKVHCGTYLNRERFIEQIQGLAKLRKLSSQVAKERIIYIDLSKPDAPSVHLKDIPPKSPE
ncbi:cell division protein FtsQ/DivIB [Crocosphaera sp. Alani8]|uniref:cell division protein FtsQ/DivIB n=1 Tax=Crocosphaera sp. Alani8 TaxID=3038952 RepID=UPI00313BCA40